MQSRNPLLLAGPRVSFEWKSRRFGLAAATCFSSMAASIGMHVNYVGRNTSEDWLPKHFYKIT